jgi:hypothetical protein
MQRRTIAGGTEIAGSEALKEINCEQSKDVTQGVDSRIGVDLYFGRMWSACCHSAANS